MTKPIQVKNMSLGEGILKIEVLDGCARFGQIVIRKSGK